MLKRSTLVLVISSVAFTAQANLTDASSPCQMNTAILELDTDKFSHQENRWTLVKGQQEVVFSGSRYAGNHQHREQLCLDDGDYTLTVEDNYGDGLSEGHYRLMVNQQTLAEGADFGYRNVHSFTLGQGKTQAPTTQPGE
ncbi:Pseudolysin [Saliniradius amylolyticus]|uniref:Pseudolysin n=1 Tax=Saliniradius amylolyticus TaxID=2183582 RepID=A0A2S2DZ52_9ALTE|nr:hypothetical protein [Saliniradius amylolyticus]AWL10674.1 Pseudolysin [Saliniradius amylolyticus]